MSRKGWRHAKFDVAWHRSDPRGISGGGVSKVGTNEITLLLEPGLDFSRKLTFGGARLDVGIRPAGHIERVVGA